MKKPKARPKDAAPRKLRLKAPTVYQSSWSTDGPVTVTIEVAEGSAQMIWLRFARQGFDGRVYTDVATATALHAELGRALAAARNEIAQPDDDETDPLAAPESRNLTD